MQPIFQEHTCLTETELKSYVSGNLDAISRHRVENHLLDCPFCTEAVEGSRLLAKQAPQKIKALNPNYRRLRAVAAVFLVAAGLVSLRFFLKSGDSDWYAAFYEPYPNEIESHLRSSETADVANGLSPELRAAFQAYEKENFAESFSLFEQELSVNETNIFAQFYGGLAALEIGNTLKAKQLLLAASQPGSLYQDEANWYLALTLLREGEDQAAIELLDEIAASPENQFREDAKELRSKF
jgi:tetratricopeptide (TPR) repeat protein